jgi:hypothetical protein
VTRLAVHGEGDLWRGAQDFLERQPPEVTAAIGEVARHVDGKRRPMAAEDRIGMVAVVAIPVIEGEAGERLFAVGVLKALADLT